MTTYRERRAARADRLREWADKRGRKAAAGFTAARKSIEHIPPGQPILVGHHSERHHRRDLARHDSKMRQACEDQSKGQEMGSRADEIERQAEQAIYSDDVDAIERLEEKLAELEARRLRMTAENRAYRKGPAAFAAFCGMTAEQEAARRALIEQGYSWARQPHAPYELQNLGGNITRTRKRLAELRGTPAPVKTIWNSDGSEGPVLICAPPPTATARAGLAVLAGMTTPSRPGKVPRPVWNVRGLTGPYRALLTELGGGWYRGAFSFWEDPTADLEAALLAREAEAQP